MNVFFSIIMPVYNGSEFLHYSIPSVLNQSYGHFEFIIIDDGSTDSSLEIIQSFKDERIISFSKLNGGAPSCYNFGIEQSSGDYIYILEHDDFIECNFLETVNQLILRKKHQLIIINMQNVNYLCPLHPNPKPSLKQGIEITFNDNHSFLQFYICNLKDLGLNYTNKLFSSSIMKSIKFDETKIVPDLSTIFKHLINVNQSVITQSTTFFAVNTPDSLSRKRATPLYLIDVQNSTNELLITFKEHVYNDIYKLSLKAFYSSIVHNSIELLNFGIVDNTPYSYLVDYYRSSLSFNSLCYPSFKQFIGVTVRTLKLTIMRIIHYIKNNLFPN